MSRTSTRTSAPAPVPSPGPAALPDAVASSGIFSKTDFDGCRAPTIVGETKVRLERASTGLAGRGGADRKLPDL
jgi:hypothetical protein